jgi:hypothetical protein
VLVVPLLAVVGAPFDAVGEAEEGAFCTGVGCDVVAVVLGAAMLGG